MTIDDIKFVANDGGRKIAGFKGTTGDCVIRALAIATGKEYADLYNSVSQTTGRPARRGVLPHWTKHFFSENGFKFVDFCEEYPARYAINEGLVPQTGTVVLQMHRHVAVLVNGELHDQWKSLWSKALRKMPIIKGFYYKDEVAEINPRHVSCIVWQVQRKVMGLPHYLPYDVPEIKFKNPSAVPFFSMQIHDGSVFQMPAIAESRPAVPPARVYEIKEDEPTQPLVPVKQKPKTHTEYAQKMLDENFPGCTVDGTANGYPWYVKAPLGKLFDNGEPRLAVMGIKDAKAKLLKQLYTLIKTEE